MMRALSAAGKADPQMETALSALEVWAVHQSMPIEPE